MRGAVWLFDVDGTLVDSFDAEHLRPLVRDLFDAVRASGASVAVWSAGGVDHATRVLARHDLGDHVTSYHDKQVGDDGRWQLHPSLVARATSIICIDDQPAQLPLIDGHVARHVVVFPYLRPDPHDRALSALIAELGQPAETSTAPAEDLRDVLRRIMPEHRARWGDSDSWDAVVAFQRALGAAGWGAPAWPEDIGGRGLGVLDQLACDAEFARAGAPRRAAVYGVNNVGPTIAAVGTPAQRAHLRAIVDGDEFWCQGFSEPDAGSDLGSLRCRAVVTADGFVVNGQKVWTSIGMNATHCMLLVRTDPDAPKHQGISALLVPLHSPGVTRRPIRQINGESEFAELFFEDVFVPSEALLGPLHDGWRVTMTTLGFERAGVIGIAGELVDDVTTMVRSEQMAHACPPLRQRAMDTYVQARILEWMGERSLAEMTASTQRSGSVSSLIKLAWSQLTMQFSVVNAELGGMDVVAGLAPATTNRLLRSRAATIAGGTTEVMKNLIGERNLGLPREPR